MKYFVNKILQCQQTAQYLFQEHKSVILNCTFLYISTKYNTSICGEQEISDICKIFIISNHMIALCAIMVKYLCQVSWL